MASLSAVFVCETADCVWQGQERKVLIPELIADAFEVPRLRCACAPDREMKLVELCGRRLGEPAVPVRPKRVFRVELEWADNVNGQPCRMSLHHDFPDASRASALATAFIPVGTEMVTRPELHEVARSATSSVRLYEVPRT